MNSEAIPDSAHIAAPRDAGALEATPHEKRIPVLDAIRGFAIFGILVSNMSGYSYPSYYLSDWGYRWGGLPNKLAWELMAFAVIGKFLTIFSFLFGLSFALQLIRTETRGKAIVPLYTRRLLALLLFGAAHAFLIWYGDILLLYAVAGFLLLLFRNVQPKALLACSLLLLCVSYGKWEYRLAQEYANASAIQVAEARPPSDTSGDKKAEDMSEPSFRAYAKGTYAEMVAQRVHDVYFNYRTTYLSLAHVLSLFLLGFYAGRRGIFQESEKHIAFFRKLAVWGFFLGILGQTGLHYLYLRSLPSWMILLRPIASAMGALSLAAFYVAGLVLLRRRGPGERLLRPLAAVGRTALSNYLLQSIVCTAIFYNCGLRLYGRVGPAGALALAVAIYAGQVLLSSLWLRRYRFGPLEWLWRTLTYGEAQKFRA
jgi:uncharacterized protein